MTPARSAVRLVLLSLAFGLAARVFGWWSAAVLGMIWGAMGTRRPAIESAGAALVGWAGLLALAAGPELLRLTEILGGLGPVPGWSYAALCLVIGGLLAGLGALVTGRSPPDYVFHHETTDIPHS